MSIEERANRILEKARKLATLVESWADFSNAICSPEGLAAAAFPTSEERQEFIRSPQNQEIYDLLHSLMIKFGTVSGGSPKQRTADLISAVSKVGEAAAEVIPTERNGQSAVGWMSDSSLKCIFNGPVNFPASIWPQRMDGAENRVRVTIVKDTPPATSSA